MKKRFLAFLLALAMVVCLVPLGAFAAEDEEPELPELRFDAVSLTVANDLSINFKVVVDEAYTESCLVVTRHSTDGDFTETITKYTPDEKGRLCFKYTGLNPQCMTDEITAELYAEDEDDWYVTELTYSIKQYLQSVLPQAEKDDPAMHELLSDLARYGEAAQIYTNYKTDNLVTNGLKNLAEPSENAGEIIKPTKKLGDYVDLDFVALELSGSFGVVIKFHLLGNATIDSVTAQATILNRTTVFDTFADLGDQTVKKNDAENVYHQYSLTFRGINATELDDVIHFAFFVNGTPDSTLDYQVNYYLNKYKDTDKDSGGLFESLLAFSSFADRYKAETEPEEEERDPERIESSFTVKTDAQSKVGSTVDVTLGSLFEAKAGKEIASNDLKVKAENQQGNKIDFVYTPASDWTESTVCFTGSGETTLTLQYRDEPSVSLKLTVVESSFTVKFKNTDKYLYRVGNRNTVALDSLFGLKEGKTVTSSDLKVEANNISGKIDLEYTPNTADWEKSTLQFTGTGVIKLSLKNGVEPANELILEVVDAVNATAATSATENNVVLLNDIGTSNQIYIQNGYTFYGNGFTVTYTGNGIRNSTAGMVEGVFTINGGTLDNVSVICKIFPRAYMYTGNTGDFDYYLKEPENTDDNGAHYKYQWSGIYVAGDNAKVLNTYVYGARNNILVGSGNVTIDNCTCSCGALSNIQITSAKGNTVTLKDVTTIQYPNTADFSVSGEEVLTMGLGILVGSDGSETNPTIVIEGELNQYNWVTGSETITSSKIAPKLLSAAAKESAYQHTYNGNTYVNLGIVFYNDAATDIHDNRSCAADYSLGKVSVVVVTGQVYSVKAGKGAVAFKDSTYRYTPTKSGLYVPVLKYQNLGTTEPTTESYIYLDSSNRIQIQFPFGDAYEMDIMNYVNFDRYTGCEKNITVSCKSAEVNGTKLTFVDAWSHDVVITVTGEKVYDQNGKLVSSNETYQYKIPVVTKTPDRSRKDAEISVTPLNTTGVKINSSGDRYFWFDIFDGLTITDYDKDGNPDPLVTGSGTKDLVQKIAKITPGGSTDLLNGTANYSTASTITILFNDGRELILNVVRTNCSNSPGGTKAAYLKTDSSSTSVYYVTGSAAASSGVTDKIKAQTFACQYKISGYKFTGFNGKQVSSSDVHVASCGLYDGVYTAPPTGNRPTTNFSGTKTLIYNHNDGTGKTTCATGSKTNLKNLERIGYRLLGWNTAKDGSGTDYAVGASYTLSETVTLYAQWAKLVNYTVTYDANGGSVSVSSTEQYGRSDIILPKPERSGYWFVGWTENQDGTGTKYAADATYNTPEKDVTLYAQWSPIYTVTYNANGGTFNGETTVTYEGTALALPEPTKEHCWFGGWSDGNKTYTNTFIPTADVILTAVWNPEYKVTFENATVSPTEIWTVKDVFTQDLPTPTTAPEGMAFRGWYNGETKVESLGKLTGDIILVAKWSKKLTVTYDANGGSVTRASESVALGNSVTLPTPTRTGYTFNGWWDGTTTYTGSYTPIESITLTAQWILNSYTIKATSLSNASFTVEFNGESYSITTISQTVPVPYGTSVTVTVSYTQNNSQSCTIKSGNTSYTSGKAFDMPAGDVELTASSSSGGGACVAAGTLITMADGSQKKIEDLLADDVILSFNHETGEYEKVPVFMVVNHGKNSYTVMDLKFADGSDLEIIESHGLFDLDLKQYVDFTKENHTDYIGHYFAKYSDDGTTKAVKLDAVELYTKETEMMAVFSYANLNAITNGFVSYDTKLFGTYNYFTCDANMKYIESLKEQDINEYGLYDYDYWKDYIPYETYEAFNFRYFKVAVEKGLCSEDDIVGYILWLGDLLKEGCIPVSNYVK